MKELPILTLTPNPALDLSGHVPQILANEKNYVIKPRLDPGGNGINVARMIARLGGKVVALGFVGGSSGEQLQGLLIKAGIKADFTSIEAETRTNVTVTNDRDHQQTRLTFPGPKVRRVEIQTLLKKLSRLKGPGLFMLGGSLPEGCPENFHFQIAEQMSKQGYGILIDLPAPALKKLLTQTQANYLFVKPNLHELEELYSTRFKNDSQLFQAARKLNESFALVTVSLGARGALFVTKKQAWFAKTPPVRARGSVGAGDSMVAGVLRMLAAYRVTSAQELNSLSEEKQVLMIRWGVAAGGATAEAEGTALGTAQRVRQLVPKIQVRSFEGKLF